MSGASCALRALLKSNPDQRGGECKGCWLHRPGGPARAEAWRALFTRFVLEGGPREKGVAGQGEERS